MSSTSDVEPDAHSDAPRRIPLVFAGLLLLVIVLLDLVFLGAAWDFYSRAGLGGVVLTPAVCLLAVAGWLVSGVLRAGGGWLTPKRLCGAAGLCALIFLVILVIDLFGY